MNYLLTSRVLALCFIVALPISTALTSLFEIILWVLVLSVRGLRQRLLAIIGQPVVYSLLAFVVFGVLSCVWSVGDLNNKIESVWGFRKALLFLLFAAIFNEHKWKYKALTTFIITVTCLSLVSSFMKLSGISFYKGFDAVIHNYATQGVFFALAAAFSLYLLFVDTGLELKKSTKLLLLLSILVTLLNVVFITTGRSGYLTILLLTILFGAYFSFKKNVFYLPLLLVVFSGVIMLSPTAKQGINVGINNLLSYQEAEEPTSMGYRMMFVENTLKLITQKPIFGHGAGGYEQAYNNLIEGQTGWRATASADPHNEYLRVTVQQGIVGLLLFFGFLAFCIFQKTTTSFILLGKIILLTWCGLALINSTFSSFTEGRVIFLWCGILLSMPITRSKKPVAT